MVPGAGRGFGIPEGKMLPNGEKERFGMLGRNVNLGMLAWVPCGQEGVMGGEAERRTQ